MEFKNLPLKDEVECYIQLNSGLPFSPGEKLHATHSCNPITKLAVKIVKTAGTEDLIKEFCKIAGKECSGKDEGRKNELLVAVYLIFHLHFREPGAPIVITMAHQFVDTVKTFNEDSEWQDTQKYNGKTFDDCKDEVLADFRRLKRLYDAVSGPSPVLPPGTPPPPAPLGANGDARCLTGMTSFRRLHICMLAVAECPEGELDEVLFAKFVVDVNQKPEAFDHGKKGSGRRLRKILTTNMELKSDKIKLIVDSYAAFLHLRGGTHPC